MLCASKSVHYPIAILLAAVLGAGCSLFRSTKKDASREIEFPPLTVTGDLELEKWNDEELFAAGSSAFAAGDFKQAARFFDRLADFHPQSKHRRQAVYNSGLSHERLQKWPEAYGRFVELADYSKGTGDSLEASFRLAETLYHLDRFDEAARLLGVIVDRGDLPINKRIEADVQRGICQLEMGSLELAEKTLRGALSRYQTLGDKHEVDDYFPAQAQFFLGEIYRIHYHSVALESSKKVDDLSRDLELKSELLLSAQGHYLRAIRLGNGYWATASGTQIGWLYEDLYAQIANAPSPLELDPEETAVYHQELKKKIRILLTKAITIYEQTLDTASRIGASNPFVERTRTSLQKMKELLLADEDAGAPPFPSPPKLTPRTLEPPS
jgi:tetratricopeptide (TPR) repeat protein